MYVPTLGILEGQLNGNKDPFYYQTFEILKDVIFENNLFLV